MLIGTGKRALFGVPLLMIYGAAAWAQPVADWRLRDVNVNSPRRNAQVSPRDYILQISAYYFGAAG